MSIYIVSNRDVINGEFRNDGKDHAAKSSFRIAVCEGVTTDRKSKEKKMTYTMLDDAHPAGYENVIKALKNEVDPKSLMGSEAMFYDLYSQMLNSDDEKSDVLFFIHGFANSFDDELTHIYKLKQLYMAKGSPVKHMVYLSWPTRGNIALTYWSDQEDARETGLMLNRLYVKLSGFFTDMFEIHKQKRCRNRIHLAAHSMGNQVLKYMLMSIPKEKLFPLFGEVLLLHSDVEDDVFEPGEPFTLLEQLSERTHIYINRSDDALRISHFTKNLNKRLGHKGPKNRDNLNSETFIVDTSELKGSTSLRDRVVDHWLYIDHPSVVKDILEVLKGTDEGTFLWREAWEEERNYFILPD
ncbi:MAG: hypothetical protein CVU05_15265 [Bacteroidetes bacterium HGW-Bacteroidetes-21]|jgi:esterase/lipase superfamily enzyme|nr:MAG: hypothetical protein CVU05_15265 [Bacteroidetes bacterium HGW-Bacteroidetes-21]